MEVDIIEENSNLSSNIGEERSRRKRRRSSFIDKSRICVERKDLNYDDSIMSECNMKEKGDCDDGWKKSYLQKLKDEEQDWQNLMWNMKYKYVDAVKKSKRPRLIDSSCIKSLSPDKIKFLNDNGACKRVIKQLNILIESTAINTKLKSTVLNTANNYVNKCKMTDLKKMKKKIYTETINETFFSDINNGTEENGKSMEPILRNDSVLQA